MATKKCSVLISSVGNRKAMQLLHDPSSPEVVTGNTLLGWMGPSE